MYMAHAFDVKEPVMGRRKHPRFAVLCRARVRIGKRQYAAYLHNISEAGARLRTVCSIRKLGAVTLRLPDLEVLHCKLSWTDNYHAGLIFDRPLSKTELTKWMTSRASYAQINSGPELYAELCELAELSEG
jgi:hypothetical protein